ncbi:MAG: hypothetical protein BA867_12215 [Desulfobacterales bacterium S5133MH16]|nr:MAG: hypothetical protein BA867_12215 [Desulfobacterales bacterium S5133MH16]
MCFPDLACEPCWFLNTICRPAIKKSLIFKINQDSADKCLIIQLIMLTLEHGTVSALKKAYSEKNRIT